MKLTSNFSKSEFDSKDGAEMPDDVLENVKIVAEQLQILIDLSKWSRNICKYPANFLTFSKTSSGISAPSLLSNSDLLKLLVSFIFFAFHFYNF